MRLFTCIAWIMFFATLVRKRETACNQKYLNKEPASGMNNTLEVLWNIRDGKHGWAEDDTGDLQQIIIPEDLHFPEGFDITDYIKPANKNTPSWWKKLVKYDKEHESTVTAKTCISFLELWKNGYLYCAPIDFTLQVGRFGWKYYTKSGLDDQLKLNSHTHNYYEEKVKTGEIENQIGPWFDEKWMNIKLDLGITMRSVKDRFDLIFMENFWYIPSSPIRAVPGVLPILDTKNCGFALNMFVRRDKTQTIEIKKGTPLGFVYSPHGKLKFIKQEDMEVMIPKAGEYIKMARKCPYINNNESNR